MEILLALTAFAWLIPNHYSPWSSAWNEAVAIFGLIAVLFCILIRLNSWRLSKSLIILPFICVVSITFQLVTGRLLFFGDGVVAAFYVSIWFAAVIVGGYLFSSNEKRGGINTLALIWIAGAALSVAIALIQWTNVFSLGIYGVDLPAGARPFGNVAQPNHLCTICFIGLCGVVWLHQQRLMSIFSFWVTALFMILGIVLSQSRTGWLQIAWFGFFLITFRNQIKLRLRCAEVLGVVAFFCCSALFFEALSKWMMLSIGRSIAEQMQTDIRFPYWRAMLDAIAIEPVFGYGWLQIGVAQQTIALNHKNFGSLFEHSHNFFLDIILWNGIIVGGLILGFLADWFWRVKAAAVNGKVFWLAMVLGGIFIHGMLEFPLEYSYFLIPAGLAIGALDRVGSQRANTYLLPKSFCWTLLLCLTITFSFLVKDYLSAEQNYRQLRLESARIGTDRLVTPAVKLSVLNQLEALLVFARIEARPGMSSEELAFMGAVSQRFGYPPVLFRYALATGLNDNIEISRATLNKICKIHEIQRCIEAKEGWDILKGKYSKLKFIDFDE